jgi:hypothetical protein
VDLGLPHEWLQGTCLAAAVLSGRSLVAMLLALYRTPSAARRKPDGDDTEELITYAEVTALMEEFADLFRGLDDRLPCTSPS